MPDYIHFAGLTSDNCFQSVTVTFIATDECGNQNSTTGTFTIVDSQGPVFEPPLADITVACTADIPPMSQLNWTDNCDGTGTVTGADSSDGASCPETITRTWTYTDNCGNTATVSQTIAIVDDEPPIFDTPPDDIYVSCSGDVPPMTDLSWTDNCDGTGTVSGRDDQNGNLVIRTWAYTDKCGNTSTAQQLITLLDTSFITIYDTIRCLPSAKCELLKG